MRALLAVALCCLAVQAGAETVGKSPRPLPNPALTGAAAEAPVTETPATATPVTEAPATEAPAPVEAKPRSRPEVQMAAADASPGVQAAVVPPGAMERSLRPLARPRALVERIAALRAAPAEAGLKLSSAPPKAEVELAAAAPPLTAREKRKKAREAASMQGAVCGVAAIKGEPIAPIGSKVTGCGVAEPVRVTSVSGVRLSQAATVDCSIAKALNSWVDEVAQPAFNGQLVELRIAAHYVCRGRNNQKGAKISEHGKGRAVDISAFVLSNGRVLSVAQNYDQLLRRIYKAGCTYFKTTLGPGSDGYHEDHFHFDTSARSGGAYCR